MTDTRLELAGEPGGRPRDGGVQPAPLPPDDSKLLAIRDTKPSPAD